MWIDEDHMFMRLTPIVIFSWPLLMIIPEIFGLFFYLPNFMFFLNAKHFLPILRISFRLLSNNFVVIMVWSFLIKIFLVTCFTNVFVNKLLVLVPLLRMDVLKDAIASYFQWHNLCIFILACLYVSWGSVFLQPRILSTIFLFQCLIFTNLLNICIRLLLTIVYFVCLDASIMHPFIILINFFLEQFVVCLLVTLLAIKVTSFLT